MIKPNDPIKVEICSPPDRDKLVAAIMIGDEQIAELNQEQNELQLEIYPRRDSKSWNISYQRFLESLEKAKTRLVG